MNEALLIGAIILMIVSAAALCAFAVTMALLGWTLRKPFKEFATGVAAQAVAAKTLAEATQAAATASAELPKYQIGHQKVALGFVLEITRFRKAVEHFTMLIVPENQQHNVVPHDERKAQQEFDIRELLDEHPYFNREDAEKAMADFQADGGSPE